MNEIGSSTYTVPRVRSTQKLPMRPHLVARKPAHHRDGDREPGGRRDEVLHGQRRHLHEIAQGRFARVGLPVGVGQKAGGGIERQIRRHIRRSEILRVERQIGLRPLQQVHQQEAENAEAQQRRRVLRPALLDVLADAGDFVGQHFQPAQHGMQEGALALEHLRHVSAQRLGADQDEREEQQRFVEFRR